MLAHKWKSLLWIIVSVLCCLSLVTWAQQGKKTVRIDKFEVAEQAKMYVRDINFEDLLKAELTKIGKFEAVKRDDLTVAVKEIQNSQSSLFEKSNTRQELGGFKSAYLAISGSLTMIPRERASGVRKEYTATVNVKVASLATATEQSRTVELTDMVQSPADLFRPLAAKTALELCLSEYPIRVAAVQDVGVTLNYGSSLLKVGDTLVIFGAASQGDEVRDPDTGAIISKKTPKQVGKLRITSVEETSAEAEVLEGQPEIRAVCTLAPAVSVAAAASPSGKEIAITGEKPSLSIGKFKYSNEFDLSQTADRSGKPITSSGGGQGSGAVGGALAGAGIGALIDGGKGALVGAGAGALGGQTADSARRNRNNNRTPGGAQTPSDQRETAIDKESQVLREMVLTKAQKSGKFTVIEQTRKDDIKEQMDNEKDGDYDQAALIARGKMQSAKYSAFGTITRFETDRKQTGFSITGGKEAVVMRITLDLRVVDNARGTVVVSDQVTGSIESDSSQTGFMGFGSASENQGSIGRLLDELSKNVVSKIVTTLWPTKIISVNQVDRMVTINAGETVVAIGDRLSIFAQGASLVDPETKEVLGHEERTIGQIEVVEPTVRFSKCRIIKPLQGFGMIQVGQVCRPVVAPATGAPAADSGSEPASSAPESKPKFTF
jgi:curli biogenesis system outer membrane secretion channel CsgG